MTEEEKAKQRIAKIAKSQALLAKAVNSLDRLFYEALLANIDKIAEDATELERIFNQFNRSAHSKVIKQFARGVVEVGQLNADYFKDVAENLDSKDYETIKRQANGTLLKRFGLNADGTIAPGMYLDSFINDKSIARTVREQAYKWQASGMGLDEFKRNLKLTVLGQPGASGIYSKYYNTYAYDTFQQADAQIQKQYADKLGLKAWLYLGGTMTSSRDKCVKSNGKVFITEEIEDWKKDEFKGKPATGYDPFIDRGGYNCRHHWNAITNAMAVARRSDLEIDTAGNLVKKTGDVETIEQPAAKAPEAKAATFKPAKSIKEAREQHLGLVRSLGVNVDKLAVSSSLSLEQLNMYGKNLSDLVNEYELPGVFNPDFKTKLSYKSSNSAYGFIRTSRSGRNLHDINFGDKTDSTRSLPRTKVHGKSRVDEANQFIATQTHEFAHVLTIEEHTFWAAQSANEKLVNYWRELKEIRTAYHKEMTDTFTAKDMGTYLDISLGNYASTNANEFMAEAFTEYKLHSKPSKYAMQVGKLIDKYFKKK